MYKLSKLTFSEKKRTFVVEKVHCDEDLYQFSQVTHHTESYSIFVTRAFDSFRANFSKSLFGFERNFNHRIENRQKGNSADFRTA